MYSLLCSDFDKEFPTICDLMEYIFASGMDPNYEITKDGIPTGDMATDFINW